MPSEGESFWTGSGFCVAGDEVVALPPGVIISSILAALSQEIEGGVCMAKYIELSAEETISTAELIGKALGLPLEKNEEKKEEDEDGSN